MHLLQVLPQRAALRELAGAEVTAEALPSATLVAQVAKQADAHLVAPAAGLALEPCCRAVGRR